MNQTELAARLRQALEDSGRTGWELSRRSNVKLRLVEALLAGEGDVPVRALVRVADSLELDVELVPAGRELREVGPTRTVVDVALEQIQPLDQPKVPPTVAELFLDERALLQRLLTFARSSCYPLLLDRVQELTGEPAPDWMPSWLLRSGPGTSCAPIHLVDENDGVERVAQLLAQRIAVERI